MTATRTHDYLGTLEIIECIHCHMDFGMLPAFRQARRDDHATFYCPAGHQMHYPQKSDTEKLRASLTDREAKLTRKRIASGVCPVPWCKRSGFDKVMAHIASQHGDWLAEHPEVSA